MNACIDQSNRIIAVARNLRAKINQPTNLKEAIEMGHEINLIIGATRGLWFGCDYSYKAKEICRDMATTIGDFMREFKVIHAATRQKAEEITSLLNALELLLHKDEYQRLNPVAFNLMVEDTKLTG